jgi:hypothetical protein
MQQLYMLYLASKAQGQLAEGKSPDEVDLQHSTAEVAQQLFPCLEEAHRHAQSAVRIDDTLKKLGYSKCFSDRAFQRMGLKQMEETITSETPSGQASRKMRWLTM